MDVRPQEVKTNVYGVPWTIVAMDTKATVRERVLALLDQVKAEQGLTHRGAALAIGLDPSMAQKLRDGIRTSIGAAQMDRIAKTVGLRIAYFTDPVASDHRAYLTGTVLERDDARSPYPEVEAYLAEGNAAVRPPVSEQHARELRAVRFSGEVTLGMAAALHREYIARDQGKAVASKAEPLSPAVLPEGMRRIGPAKKR